MLAMSEPQQTRPEGEDLLPPPDPEFLRRDLHDRREAALIFAAAVGMIFVVVWAAYRWGASPEGRVVVWMLTGALVALTFWSTWRLRRVTARTPHYMEPLLMLLVSVSLSCFYLGIAILAAIGRILEWFGK